MYGSKSTADHRISYFVDAAIRRIDVRLFYDDCMRKFNLAGADTPNAGYVAVSVEGDEIIIATRNKSGKRRFSHPDRSIADGIYAHIAVPESRGSEVEQLAARYNIRFRERPVTKGLVIP